MMFLIFHAQYLYSKGKNKNQSMKTPSFEEKSPFFDLIWNRGRARCLIVGTIVEIQTVFGVGSD